MQAGLPYFNIINIPSFVNEISTVIIVNIFHWMFVQAEDPPTSAPALVTSPSAAVVSLNQLVNLLLFLYEWKISTCFVKCFGCADIPVCGPQTTNFTPR